MIIKSSFSIGESPISSVWRKAVNLLTTICTSADGVVLWCYWCLQENGKKKLDIVGPLLRLMAAFVEGVDVFVFLSPPFMVTVAKTDKGFVFVFVYVLVFVVVFVC